MTGTRILDIDRRTLAVEESSPRFYDFTAVARRYGARLARDLETVSNRCDPVADAAVNALSRLSPGRARRLIDAAATGAVDPDLEAPELLLVLLDEMTVVPDWVDAARIDRGRRAFLRAGPGGLVAAFFYSLPLEYSSPAGSKVLMLTGSLSRRAKRRLAETGRYIAAILAPGGLEVGSPGWSITFRVRLMHAQVRRLAGNSGLWEGAWGPPINQLFMIGTSLGLPCSFSEGLPRLGWAVDEDEAEDVLFLWRYAGWLMGCDASLLPTSVDEASRMAEAILCAQGRPDDDCRALVDAMLGATPISWLQGKHWFRAATSDLIRRLIGDDLADPLGLPENTGSPTYRLLRLFLAGYGGMQHVPGGGRLLTAIGGRIWEAVVRSLLAGRKPTYQLPQRLALNRGAG